MVRLLAFRTAAEVIPKASATSAVDSLSTAVFQNADQVCGSTRDLICSIARCSNAAVPLASAGGSISGSEDHSDIGSASGSGTVRAELAPCCRRDRAFRLCEAIEEQHCGRSAITSRETLRSAESNRTGRSSDGPKGKLLERHLLEPPCSARLAQTTSPQAGHRVLRIPPKHPANRLANGWLSSDRTNRLKYP